MSIMKKIFPWRLKALREAIGIPQGEFAEALGVARATVSYYETGQRLPDIDFIARVHELTGCSINYLMGYDSNMGEHSTVIASRTGLNDKAIEELNFFDQASINFILTNRNFWDMSYTLTTLTDPDICTEYLDNEEAVEFIYHQVQIYARKLAVDMYEDEALREEKAMEKEHSQSYSGLTQEMEGILENVKKVSNYINNEKAKNSKENILVRPNYNTWVSAKDREKAESDKIMRFKLRLQALERTLQVDNAQISDEQGGLDG